MDELGMAFWCLANWMMEAKMIAVAQEEQEELEKQRQAAAKQKALQKERDAYNDRVEKSWVNTRVVQLDVAEQMARQMGAPVETISKIGEYKAQTMRLAGSFDPGMEMTPQMKAEEEILSVPRGDLDVAIRELSSDLGVLLGAHHGLYDGDRDEVKQARERMEGLVAKQPAKREATTPSNEPQAETRKQQSKSTPKRSKPRRQPVPQPRPKPKEKSDDGFSL